jgi:hypothetical protein
MANFRPIDRDTGFLMPPSVNEWLPTEHLARFIVEVVESLDLRAIIGSYQGKGSARTTRACCWLCFYMATRRGCSPAASWNVRPMTRWRSVSSPPTSEPAALRSRLARKFPAMIATGGRGDGPWRPGNRPPPCSMACRCGRNAAATAPLQSPLPPWLR